MQNITSRKFWHGNLTSVSFKAHIWRRCDKDKCFTYDTSKTLIMSVECVHILISSAASGFERKCCEDDIK